MFHSCLRDMRSPTRQGIGAVPAAGVSAACQSLPPTSIVHPRYRGSACRGPIHPANVPAPAAAALWIVTDLEKSATQAPREDTIAGHAALGPLSTVLQRRHVPPGLHGGLHVRSSRAPSHRPCPWNPLPRWATLRSSGTRGEIPVICASCGADNDAGRKFCLECGASLAAGCPACGTPNPPAAQVLRRVRRAPGGCRGRCHGRRSSPPAASHAAPVDRRAAPRLGPLRRPGRLHHPRRAARRRGGPRPALALLRPGPRASSSATAARSRSSSATP